MNIKCLIFDCDGLMFNTEYYSRENWLNVGRKYNIPMDDELFKQIIGAGATHFQKVMESRPDIPKYALIELLPSIRESKNTATSIKRDWLNC